MAMAAATSLPPGFGGISMTRPHENPPPRFRRSRKRVTWAAADQLCQTRMFLAEDAPFLAGMAQEQLQVKTTSFMHMADDLPPGFGGNVFGGGVASCMRPDSQALAASVAAPMSWRCPQKIELDPTWNIRAGEESKELEIQKQRESKTLEAVYPRATTIPTSPLEPMEPPAFTDDSRIPVIPVTSLDEDSDGDDNSTTQGTKPAVTNEAPVTNYVNGGGLRNGAVNTSVKPPAFDQGALPGIDTNLLLQLLANPSLVETLSGVRNISMVNTSIGNGSAQSIENITSNPLNQSVYPPYGGPPPPPPPTITPLSSTSTWTPAFQQPVHVQAPVGLRPVVPGASSVTQVQSPVVAGTHTNGNQFVPVVPNGMPGQFNTQHKQYSSQQEFNKREGGKGYRNYVNNEAPPTATTTGFRSKKPCLFYNTGKGCRNGLKCPFVHDMKTDKGVLETKKGEKGVNDNKGQKRRREDMEDRRRSNGERDRRERDR